MRWNDAGLRAGQALFAVATAGLGVQGLIKLEWLQRLAPGADETLVGGVLARVLCAVLAASAPFLLVRRARRAAATIQAVVLSAWIMLLHAPAIAAAPGAGGAWGDGFVTVGLLAGAAMLAGEGRAIWTTRIGSWMFGCALVAFGVIHYRYHAAIASMIPGWIPGREQWPYATSAANIAAGLGLLTGVKPRLAAALVGAMFGSWVVLLHLPQVAARPGDAAEWTALLIALGLWGGAWIAAAGATETRARSESLAHA